MSRSASRPPLTTRALVALREELGFGLLKREAAMHESPATPALLMLVTESGWLSS
eukprot:CAMPEP_0197568672 /NCGR_PEP_ID=MMETSP1320-20131121/37711_1 /TAXON_ID=91990 /ORGANISM="Bolidomonas sp., Strain RCC2347" /LENGTH=54 /DNA_ID=CAMNT_0043130959 /DNA_START=14 /DNA_END=175 /DNA_ORIENTATION=-